MATGRPMDPGEVFTGRILIVDDELANVRLVERLLRRAGYSQVLGTTDPSDVMALVREWQPDLILLDLRMPRVDGFALLEALRQDLPEDSYLPVLVLTADVTAEARTRALGAGAHDFLTKPFDPTETLLPVRNLLHTRSLHLKLTRRTQMLRDLFGRYLPDAVVEQLLNNPTYSGLGGRRVAATMLFGDLRGFTSLIEPMPAEQAVALLNSFLTPMVEILFEHGGMLDKFRGDGIMAVFGVPDQRPDDALRAIKAAVAMQERIGTMAVPSAPGLRLQMGIGINTGLVVAGNIGAPQRYDFTVVGDAVNLAARFEGNAGPGQILITQSTYDLVAPYVEALPLGTLRVKGKVEWVPAYQVLRLRSPELPVDRGTAASTGQFPGETAASAAAANASVAHTSQFVPLLRTIRSFPDAGAS